MTGNGHAVSIAALTARIARIDARRGGNDQEKRFMSPDPAGRKGPDDVFTLAAARAGEASATLWLVRQLVATVHATDGEQSPMHRRYGELLQGRDDLIDEVRGQFFALGHADPMLRWSLLYALADILSDRAAEFLTGVVLSPLPEPDRRHCQSTRDTEILVRTMAIEVLRRIAARAPEVSRHLLQVVSARPEPALLVEAVKACSSLGLTDQLKAILPQDSHWMLDIRKAERTELTAQSECRSERKPLSMPPRRPLGTNRPSIKSCGCC